MSYSVGNKIRSANIIASGLGCNTYNITNVSLYDNAGPSTDNLGAENLLRDTVYQWDLTRDSVIFCWGDRADNRTIGDELADLIEKLGLGTVIRTPATHNFNYPGQPEHACKVWCWSVDQKALQAYGIPVKEAIKQEIYDIMNPKKAVAAKVVKRIRKVSVQFVA